VNKKEAKKTTLKLARPDSDGAAAPPHHRDALYLSHTPEGEQKFFGSFFQKRTSSFLLLTSAQKLCFCALKSVAR
jgi:hypothetical protein